MINPARIRIIAVGKVRKGWVSEGVETYRKRLPGLEIVELRDGGTPVPPAWTHAVYVVLEAVKVVSLALLVKSAGRSFV